MVVIMSPAAQCGWHESIPGPGCRGASPGQMPPLSALLSPRSPRLLGPGTAACTGAGLSSHPSLPWVARAGCHDHNLAQSVASRQPAYHEHSWLTLTQIKHTQVILLQS